MKSKVTRDFARFPRTPVGSLLPRNRSGSHVGMILSFVIFITFVVFLYSVIRPAVATGEDKKTTLSYIEKKVEGNTSAVLATITVKIQDSKNPTENCVKLEKFFVYSLVSAHLIVENETKNWQDAYYDPANDFDDLRINRKDRNNLFFKIYYSPEFDKLQTTAINPCTLVHYLADYNITSVVSGSYVFEKRIYELVDYYQNDYEKLRDAFNVPSGTEFGLGFTQSNGTKITIGNAPKSVSVYAGETPIQYIDDNANIQSGFINVKVW